MSNLFERYNEKQKQKAIVASMDSKDIYGKYKAAKEAKSRIELVFDSADNEGNLKTIDENGVSLVLPLEEIKLTDASYTLYSRKRYVGIRMLEVTVGSIEEETKTVRLKNGRVNAGILSRLRGELFAQANEVIKTRRTEDYKPVSIYGTIRSVDRNRENAFVELLGVQGLYGVIHISQWAKTRTRIIPEDAEYLGIPQEFHLIGVTKIEDINYFRLSRKDIYNPCQDIPEEFFERGNAITVECVHIPENGNYWIGKVKNLPIEIRCNYTDRYDKGIISPGRSFICTVKKGVKELGYIYANPYRYLMTAEEREQARQNGKMYITKEDLDRLEKQRREEIRKEQQNKEAGIKPE